MDKKPDDSSNPSDGNAPTTRAGAFQRSKSEANAGAANSTPQKELQYMWKDLVQKQRIHELIKFLQSEKRKLKFLHNIEPDWEFIDYAAKHQSEAAEAKEKDGKPETAGTDEQPAEKDKEAQRGSGGSQGRRSSEFESSTSHMIRHHNVHARNAAKILYNKGTDITDQELNEIVELCEDKIEQKVLLESFKDKQARDKYLKNAAEWRIMLYNFINSKFFVNFMLGAIVISIVAIFLLTFESIAIRYAWPLITLDSLIVGIFLAEAILKIVIYKEDYFKLAWNLLDLVIIIVYFVELAVDMTTRTLALSANLNASIWFKFFKSLRALRLLRVIKFLPNLEVIVTTIFRSMNSIGAITVLMALFIMVFAVMGRGLFYEWAPDKFGNLWRAHVTLFQLLTLDDWFELLESSGGKPRDEEEFDELEEPDSAGYWLMFAYLFAYLVIEYFVFLNLFVAVLVDNFQLILADSEIQKQRKAEEEREAQKKFEDMEKDILLDIDPTIAEREHEAHKRELKELAMHAEDYFQIDKDSREAELLSEIFKDMNSLDFERFLLKRRYTLFNKILDAALNSHSDTIYIEEEESEEEDEDLPGRNSNDNDGGLPQSNQKDGTFKVKEDTNAEAKPKFVRKMGFNQGDLAKDGDENKTERS